MKRRHSLNQSNPPPEKTTGSNYLVAGMIFILWIIIVRFALPWEAIPYKFEEFLTFKGSISEIFRTSWPIFAIGGLINIIVMAKTVNPPEVQQNVSQIPIYGFLTSLTAGVLEEIVFRWIFLYAFMGLIWLINLATYVLVGLDLLRFIVEYLLVDVFNHYFGISFIQIMVGQAQEVIDHQGAWTLGCALILANWKFQKGHLYQGVIGFLFSGLAGLVFFRLTFVFGLPIAIIVHFSFDMFVFLMLLGDVLIEKYVNTQNPQSKMYYWYGPQSNQP